jgi:hypothetical protein
VEVVDVDGVVVLVVAVDVDVVLEVLVVNVMDVLVVLDVMAVLEKMHGYNMFAVSCATKQHTSTCLTLTWWKW